jgi:hypothetical protein
MSRLSVQRETQFIAQGTLWSDFSSTSVQCAPRPFKHLKLIDRFYDFDADRLMAHTQTSNIDSVYYDMLTRSRLIWHLSRFPVPTTVSSTRTNRSGTASPSRLQTEHAPRTLLHAPHDHTNDPARHSPLHSSPPDTSRSLDTFLPRDRR